MTMTWRVPGAPVCTSSPNPHCGPRRKIPLFPFDRKGKSCPKMILTLAKLGFEPECFPRPRLPPKPMPLLERSSCSFSCKFSIGVLTKGPCVLLSASTVPGQRILTRKEANIFILPFPSKSNTYLVRAEFPE